MGRERVSAVRRLVAAGVAVLAVVAGCGDNGGGSGGSADGGSGGEQPQARAVQRALLQLDVCSVVDLDALVVDAMQGQYETDPVSVPRGAGTDMQSNKCFAQIRPPDLLSHGARISTIGKVTVGVSPSESVEAAAEDFDSRWFEGTVERLEKLEETEVSEPRELDGPWERGYVITAVGARTGVIALAQQDSYFMVLDLSYDTGDNVDKGYPFTLDEIVAAAAELLASMAAVMAAEAGRVT